MVDLVYCLKNLLFFGISLLYYYINLRSSILFCLCFGGLHLTYFFVRLYIFWFISNCFRIILWWSCQDFCNFICKFVSSCFCCFQIVLLEAVLSASVADCLTWSRSPWLYLLLKFLLMFLPIFLLMFLTKHKNW